MSFEIVKNFDRDLEQQFAFICSQSFSFPVEKWQTFRDRIGRENYRLMCDGSSLVGGLAFYRMGQWFGGNELPTAGIALVSIAPERRGTGASTTLLNATLRELYANGFALATLYASTQTVYRRVGFEQAGHYCEFEIDCRSLGKKRTACDVVPATAQDQATLEKLTNNRAATNNGNISRTPGLWERIFNPREYDSTACAYLVQTGERVDGYVIYLPSGGPFSTCSHLSVRDMVFKTREAAESIWSFLAGHRSIYKTIRWRGPYSDPLLSLTAEDDAQLIHRMRWMIRVVNVAKTLSERGYPPELNERLDFEIEDPLIPENHGRFSLTVNNGVGSVVAGGRGGLRLEISAMSPLISSLYSTDTLVRLGMIEGDDKTIGVANRIFAGPVPWMPDTF